MRRVLAVLTLTLAASAGAQVAGRPARPTPTRNPADTLRRDAADTTKSKILIKWEDPDSMTTALLGRKGYEITRYQGVKVTFNAKDRTLYLEGGPAGVSRGATILIGDTITYNDSTKIVLARGDTLVLRDPSRGSSDVIALGQMRYNVESRRGSVTNISTAVESGEKWYVFGAAAGFVNDTTGGKSTRFYARNGSITSCDDSIPDYHFHSKEIKLISKNLLVARPAVLYIGDVPVFWLPFIFQDMRSGRRSGLLTPRFGVNELFRNSPSYRRHVDNFGYYFAFSDYMDAQVSMDWRSGAASSESDPGWLRLNGEWRYRWLDRFMTGRFGVSQLWQRDGTRNTALSWAHQQDFSQTTHLTTDMNYVTSTAIQRRNSFDPQQVLATIQSRVNYQQQFGPASVSIGGDRRQYPGRSEVTQNFPNFSISTPTLSLGKALDWTPSLNVTNQQQFKVDRNGEFAYRYLTGAGKLDSTRLKYDARVSSLNFNTPLKIFGFTLSNTIRVSDQENNNPVRIAIINQADPTQKTERVFARTFSTEIDWSTSFGLPQFFPTTLKLSPAVSINNVDGRSYWVRTEQSGGRYVHQSKRLSYGLSASPTLFGLFPGFGPVSRFRHTISPNISYSYAPAASVSPEFLAALNENPKGYLGNLASNKVTLSLSQVLEAKLRPKDTASTAEPRKIKLLGVNFSPVSYDFERKRKTGHSGFDTDNLSMDFNSDLLPGFQASMQYSLFQGSVLSDTSKFKPFRTGINASFSVNGNSGIFGALTRIFGRAVPQGTPQVERLGQGPNDALEQRVASTPVAGTGVRNQQYAIPAMQTWQASFTFSSTRQRPPTGNGTVIVIDPKEKCTGLPVGFIYDECILQQSTQPVGADPIGRLTQGGPFIRVPARETLTSNMGFHITEKWSATWGTMYDFQERQFASHTVSLQRELHDWRSIFAFTRSPNGNFAFNFFIALNAQPDLKFNFDRQTYRQTNQ
jgi:lipopolysaccharide assembly outer membrane protein LptD (OstA)